MEHTHTPGPWTAHTIPGKLFEIRGNGAPVLRIRGGLLPMSADARLLEAAPDLVKELRVHVAHSIQSLKDIGGCDHSVGICCCDLIRDIRNANDVLAKLES